MKIYTYCIIDSNNEIDSSVKGLKGATVFNTPYLDIGVVASNLNGKMRNVTKIQVLEHEAIIEKMMEKFSVLPIRFLTVFNRKEDVLSMMKDYYSDFKENLDRLRNKVEFGIKVIWPADKIKESIINAYKRSSQRVPIFGDSPGKSFIKEKFEKYKIDKEFEEEADRRIAIVDNFLGEFAVEKKLEKLKSKNLFLNASYLVKKEKQDDFKRAFKRLKGAFRDFKYLFSGPWPAYNFVILKGKTKLWTK